MANDLRISFLGGVEEIGKNLTVLEYDKTMILVDAGIAFPDNDVLPGVDYVTPNFTYVLENKDKLKGIFVTHGHEDHIGSIPELLKEVKVPVYGSNISLGFLQNKLAKRNMKKKVNFNTITDKDNIIKVGPFTIEFVRVTHSIPGAYSLWIKTPKGGLFFTGDFKIDHTPIDKRQMDFSKLIEISKQGVLLLLSDSTNADKPGYSLNEKRVGESLDAIFGSKKNNRIIVATFASNVHRIQQIYDCATKHGRRVVLMGKSLEDNVGIAIGLGELKIDPNMLCPVSQMSKVPYDKVCIIATGSQGEPRSALSKMSVGESRPLVISDKDTIILSARAIPGNERTIYKLINNLSKLGAEVIYKSLYDIHCSGHAYQEELKLMLALLNPSYFVPVHGEIRHMKEHAKIAKELGINPKNILLPSLGMSFTMSKRGFGKVTEVEHGSIYMSGDTETNEEEIAQRRILADQGVVVIVVPLDKMGLPTGEVNIVSKGIVLSDDFKLELAMFLKREFEDGNVIGLSNDEIEDEVIRISKRRCRISLGRTPFIIPVIEKEEY